MCVNPRRKPYPFRNGIQISYTYRKRFGNVPYRERAAVSDYYAAFVLTVAGSPNDNKSWHAHYPALYACYPIVSLSHCPVGHQDIVVLYPHFPTIPDNGDSTGPHPGCVREGDPGAPRGTLGDPQGVLNPPGRRTHSSDSRCRAPRRSAPLRPCRPRPWLPPNSMLPRRAAHLGRAAAGLARTCHLRACTVAARSLAGPVVGPPGAEQHGRKPGASLSAGLLAALGAGALVAGVQLWMHGPQPECKSAADVGAGAGQVQVPLLCFR